MAKPTDPWHFPRPDLAAAYLNGFELGLVAARGLFARRRMGKTEFLKQDLIPAAQKKGFLAAYTNLWDDTEHPGQAIASAIYAAVKPTGLARFWDGLSTPLRKVKAGGKLPPGIEASLELDLAQKEKLAVPAIQAALQAADSVGKSLVLIVDEAQVLASPLHQPVAHSLRAGLDIRKASVKVLFAGSSESALREMFARPAAPFYNWAPVEPFPLLGEDFVAATVAQVRRLAKKPLALSEAQKAFQAVRGVPEFFRWYIERYMLYQDLGAGAALAHTLERVHDDAGYAGTWKELSRPDRALLLIAAGGVQDLYGAAARKHLGQLLGLDEVSASTPRTSLRRLTGAKWQLLARVDHGSYRFEDQEFEAWVRGRQTID